MRKEKALLRLQSMGEKPIYNKKGNLIFRQRFPYTALVISIIALAIALMK